jgi:hypothetical protein
MLVSMPPKYPPAVGAEMHACRGLIDKAAGVSIPSARLIIVGEGEPELNRVVDSSSAPALTLTLTLTYIYIGGGEGVGVGAPP